MSGSPSALPASAIWSGWTIDGRAVEPLHAAAHDDILADRQAALEPGGIGVEEGERDLAGVVEGEDAIGDGAVAARRRLMPVDAKVKRDDRPLRRRMRCPGGCGDR